MKKILLTSFIILISVHSSILYADECNNSCPIADAPAPALTEYFANIETIQSNILAALNNAESEVSAEKKKNESGDDFQIKSAGKSILNSGKNLLQSLNSLMNFNSYFGSFDFKISLPITNEVPNEVKRDHRKLESITNKLTHILETSHSRNSQNISVTDICEGVSYCTISTASAKESLIELIKNNTEITRLYETSILDKAFLSENRNFILVSNDFEGQIEQYYNKDTLGLCSSCEGNSWSEVKDTIQNISIKNGQYKDGIQKWRDAWALLRGGSANRSASVQKQVLSDYLGDQGLAKGQADTVISNLERYEGESISGSNPLLNSSNYAQAGVENTLDSFSQTLSQEFEGREKVPIVELAIVNSEIKGSDTLALEIKSLYEEQLPYAQSQDIGSQQLQLRILNMHNSLVRTINTLEKHIRTSEKLCDKQGTGMGKCSY